ncbi:MAG: IclR family transcriptional regulator, partial [Blastopirellula sp. JB062]
SKRYTITNKFLLLGQPQGRQKGLVEAVIPAMRALRKATGETTQICCLVEDKNVILEQLISNHPFKYSAELGARCPAYSCAPGKAIIANLPLDEREELVGRLRLKRFTPTTITTKQAFAAELEKIKTCGFAVDHAEGLEGIHCVAAVVLDSKNYPVGSITIAGPSYRLPEDQFAELGKVVMEATRQATLSYRQ